MTQTQGPDGVRRPRRTPPLGIARPTPCGDSGEGPVGTLLLALIILVLIAQCAALLWLIWGKTPDVPWWDEWETVVLVHKFDRGTIGLSDLWAFHNEHRIVIPRLVNLSLIELTSWNRQIEMTVDLLIAVGAWTLLVRCAWQSLRSRSGSALLGIPYALLVLSLAQYENFLWPFQITFIATVFGVTVCVWALGTQPVGRRGFALAVLGALIASFSSVAGLMVWTAFLPALWGAGFHRARYIPIWIAIAAAVIVPYAQGFPGNSPASHSPLDILRYASAYLGSPVGSPGASSSHAALLRAQILGMTSVAVTLANVLLYLRLRGNLRPLLAWIGLGIFALACDAITSFGRGLTYGIAQALEPRYEAFSALWWVAGITIGAMTVQSSIRAHVPPASWRQRAVPWAVVGGNVPFFAIACLSLMQVNLVGFDHGRHWMDTQRRHEECILYYDSASDDCLGAYYVPDRVRATAAYLEQDHLSLFAHETAVQVSNLARAQQQTRSFIETVGAISLLQSPVNPVPILQGGPVPVSGWAVDEPAQASASVVFVTIDGSLHIPASYGSDRPDIAAALGIPAYGRSGFTAVIDPDRLTPGKHTMTIEIVAKDKNVYFESSQRVDLEVRSPADLVEIARETRSDFGLRGAPTVSQAGGASVLVPHGQSVTIEGWAVDSDAQAPASAVDILVDGDRDIRAAYGVARPDVSGTLGNPAYLRTGFTITIPWYTLSPGAHVLTIRVVSTDNRGYYRQQQRLQIEIE